MTTTHIKLAGPEDIISTVPFLLGFEPEHSLVVVALNDTALECTFRVDLPQGPEWIHELHDLTPQVKRNGCDRVLLLAYGEAAIASACLNRTAADFEAAGIRVLDQLRITGDRYYHPTAMNRHLREQGRKLPGMTAAACEFALEGGFALPDRNAVAAQLAPVEADQLAAVATAVDVHLRAEAALEWAEQRSTDLYTIDHWMESTELPEADDIASLALALSDVAISDYTLRQIAQTERDNGDRIDLWLWITRHLTDMAAPAATLAGFCAYRAGNGILALEAFELALRAQPTYRLALQLMNALQGGVPPREIPVPTIDPADHPEQASA